MEKMGDHGRPPTMTSTQGKFRESGTHTRRAGEMRSLGGQIPRAALARNVNTRQRQPAHGTNETRRDSSLETSERTVARKEIKEIMDQSM